MKTDHLITSIVSVLLAVIGLAIIAVLVSNGAQTGNVLGQGGSAFANIICKALAPVTGSSCGGVATSVTSVFHPITS
jgi:PRD1 phage membrane DNA delivery